MKYLLILITLLISNFVLGQNEIGWGFEIKFKIETKDTWRVNLIDDTDFLINDRYFNHWGGISYKVVKYDSISKEYRIILNYRGVGGGGSEVAYVHCPEIYIKVCFSEDTLWKAGKHFSFIPIYFENAKGSYQKYNLGTIKLSEFLNDYMEVEGENSVLPPYEIIKVKADNTIYKKRKGEYEPRRMNKMVKLELENEN